MIEQKRMHFANFNITFGEKDEPMLQHFFDVVYPAFTSDLIRGNVKALPYFRLDGVEIKELANEYVLVGNCIKVTEYVVRTVIENGELVSSPEDVPTAPYSRFIIFLRNHRMVLVMNEPSSPDIRSFQATVREILNLYIKSENKKIDSRNPVQPKLPHAIVNIVDMLRKEDVRELLKGVKTIHELDIKFFALNNDIDPTPLSNDMHKIMGITETRNAEVILKTPKSKKGVSDLLEKTTALGQATTIMRVTDVSGKKSTYSADKFTSNVSIPIQADVVAIHDGIIVEAALQDQIIKGGDSRHNTLYQWFVDRFRRSKS